MPVIGNHIFSTMWSRWLVSAPVILLYYQIVLTITNCLTAVPLLAAEAAFSGGGAAASSDGSSNNNRHLRYSDSLSDTYSNSYDSILSDNSYDHLPAPEPLLPSLSAPYQQHHRSQSYKISPKPCTIGSIDGTCMFVWECIKSEGQHVGMCVDTFMFGSCCAHNLTQNVIMPQTFSFTRPPPSFASSAYLPSSSGHHKPRPPSSISGVTTIERPHGAGTLVVRHPPGPHHQTVITHHHGSSNYYQPQYQKPVTSSSSSSTTSSSSSSPLSGSSSTPSTFVSTTKNPSLTNSLVVDMETSASISSSLWNTSPQTIQWHMTTQPNFITKPRPPIWEKPSKPIKPSKKPIQTQASFMTTRRPIVTSGNFPTKTKPQTLGTKPTKPSTTTKPYSPYYSSSSNTPLSSPTTSRPISSSTFYFPSTQHSSPSSPSPYPTYISSASFKPTKGPIKFTTTTTTTPSVFPVRLTPPPLNLTTIESNEILNHVTTNDNPIKTISAARSECGVPSLARPETRIVGGKSAPFGRWPWQVSVRRTSFFGFSSTHRCGGALINENWIATAGHCVDDLLTSQIRIRVGEYDFSHVQEQLPYIERGVSKKVVHPKYNFFTYEYDLALVKLEQPLEFAPHVSPICLPSTDSLLIGMNATVTGWGRLSEGGTLPSVLQEVSVPIVSNDRCKSMFLRAGRQEFIPDIFLCAGYETGGQDSCQGDSGGPLQVKSQDGRFFLAGIISWGIGCAEANLPGVCTRISKFVPWIMENVV